MTISSSNPAAPLRAPHGHRTARPQALAMVSLLAMVLLLVALVVFLFRNGGYVVLGIAGFALAVAGGWWLATERSLRRTVGVLALGGGLALVIGALIGIGDGSGGVLLRTVAVVALCLVAVVTARGALNLALRDGGQAAPIVRVRPPAHPVLICNPRSGGGKVEKFGLVELAETLDVETVVLEPGLDLEQLAREAVARGADCLGMAGGDGSQALVASIAVEYDLPFVCVSAGTRNHFALDLGLDRDDPRRSLHAFKDAVERRVDYATVNGRFFVNNVSLGVYATIVQQEGYREAKSETSRRLLPELLGRTTEPFDLQFETPDGASVDGAFLVMVSNNPYVLGGSLDVSQRRRLDSNKLGVFAVSATTGAQAAQVVSMALAGRGDRSGHAFEFTTDRFEIRSRSGKAFAGIDGEALELDTPLVFRIHPNGLRMLVPEGNAEAALHRRSRDVHPRDLIAIARGAPISSADG